MLNKNLKANLYMLIKIEIDKDIKDTTEFKKNFVKRMIVYGLILITTIVILNYLLEQIMENIG